MSATIQKYLGSIVTILVLICGLAVNWGVMTVSIDHLEDRVSKAEDSQFRLQIQVSQLEINQARDNSTLESIEKTMAEIKEELREFRKELTEKHYVR